MMIQIPQLFSREEVKQIREALEKADWVDGKQTAGHLAQSAKNNLQLANGELADRIANAIVDKIGASPLFISAALPLRVHKPRVNRYEGGGNYGYHVDNAIQMAANTNIRIRTDVSSTVFFSDPDEYEGGELVIQDTYGSQRVKLPAGDMIVYPGTSLHQVTPVSSGTRYASFFWTQSMVRDDTQRALLFELDRSIQNLTQTLPDSPELLRLSGVYHNLLRQWSET